MAEKIEFLAIICAEDLWLRKLNFLVSEIVAFVVIASSLNRAG